MNSEEEEETTTTTSSARSSPHGNLSPIDLRLSLALALTDVL